MTFADEKMVRKPTVTVSEKSIILEKQEKMAHWVKTVEKGLLVPSNTVQGEMGGKCAPCFVNGQDFEHKFADRIYHDSESESCPPSFGSLVETHRDVTSLDVASLDVSKLAGSFVCIAVPSLSAIALADEYPIYSERYDANESRIFERASRELRLKPKNLDLKTAFDVDKRLNPATYHVRFRQMFEDAVEGATGPGNGTQRAGISGSFPWLA